MVHDDGGGSTRRSLLSGLAGAALLGAGGVGGAVPDTSAATALGTFEDGLDGWRAAGGERLSRVGRRDWPPAVTHGEVALCVDPDGSAAPAVRRPLDGVDLESAPFVVADATPGVVDGTDAPVAFAFRVRDGLDAAILAASEPVTVRQAAPGRIYWDASDVGATTLAGAAVLEIAWWPEAAADRPYRGEVVLDNVRATPDRTALEAVRFRVAVRHLEADHGSYRRTTVEARDGDRERGRYVFAGGATVPYRARRTADGGCRITLDGDHYRFGGESA